MSFKSPLDPALERSHYALVKVDLLDQYIVTVAIPTKCPLCYKLIIPPLAINTSSALISCYR